jgi:hypothetical protein
MTESEVRAILGGPAGDYARGEVVTYVRGCVGADESGYYQGTNWWGRQGMIQVQFSEDGRVQSAAFYPAHVSDHLGWRDRLRARLPFMPQRNRHGWVPGSW